MEGEKVLSLILTAIIVIGAINWLAVAINPKYNLVKMALGDVSKLDQNSTGERVVYALVGISGLALTGLYVKNLVEKKK
jgi:uncharacterized membrane protein YuzA (DUF378 family)